MSRWLESQTKFVSRLLAQGVSALKIVTVMGIRTSGGEIIGFVKKLKDTELADSQKA